MTSDFASRWTGGMLLVAVIMLWLGSTLLPVQPGTFFQAGDFAAIHSSFHLWIWLFRIHLFGLVMAVMGLTSLAAMLSGSPARIVVWPGVAVAGSGLMVGALASAFYYHFGAWGALDMHGQATDSINQFVSSLRNDTEYVTCLVRFGRVFFGLGQVVLAFGLLTRHIRPAWLCPAGIVLGVAAMALTMAFPDQMHYYRPLFHVNALWLFGLGAVIFFRGLEVN